MGSDSVQIVLTDDGSHSLFDPELKETYHSIHGAIQESQYVFINNGLKYLLDSGMRLPKISILEVGFGTGLNALLTVNISQIHVDTKFEYSTLEPYPVPDPIINKLNYNTITGLGEKIWHSIHRAPWNKQNRLYPNFELLKIKSTIEDFSSDNTFQLVYFDAFAPGKQPEVWHMEVFRKIYSLMSDQGILVTYCAQGKFKRTLKSVGFKVESLKGPPGKMEMVRAVKN